MWLTEAQAQGSLDGHGPGKEARFLRCQFTDGSSDPELEDVRQIGRYPDGVYVVIGSNLRIRLWSQKVRGQSTCGESRWCQHQFHTA
jgi:hypothetical protein